MAVAGWNIEYFSEFVDLSPNNLTCPDVPDYPIMYGTVGTFINNKAFVCGGHTNNIGDDDDDYHDQCFSYDQNVRYDK